MIDRNLLQELQKQGYSMSEMANYFQVSRQRIYQIVNSYKNTGKKSRNEKYRNFGKCVVCGNKSEHLHHKDFNNQNDTMENLEPLCRKCHKLKHKIHNQEEWLNASPYRTIEEAKQLLFKDWKENKISHREIFKKYPFSKEEIIDLIRESKIDPFYK